MTDIERTIMKLMEISSNMTIDDSNKVITDRVNALDTAIDALREKQEREYPKPLTIDELNQMIGEPVWIEYAHVSGWEIANGIIKSDINEYGKSWVAYRHKPRDKRG